MHVLKDASVPKLKEHIGDNKYIPLFQDVGALGNSSSYAVLQSLPHKFWQVLGCGTCAVQNLNVLQRVAQKTARRNSGVIFRTHSFQGFES